MANRTWIGGAEAVAQVQNWTFAGTWETTDIVNVVIGTRTESVVTGSATISTLLDTIVTALNASTQAEFAEITWSKSGTTILVGTADTAGVPFTATVSTTETGGGAADAQTIDGTTSSTGTVSVACTGPNHADSAQNWSGATLPVNSDTIIFADSDVDCLYGLTGLSSLTGITLKVYQSFTGDVGLPATNAAGGYSEYRSRYFQLTGATLVEVGLGEGAGSSRLMFDFQGTVVTAMNVLNTGPPSSGEEVALFFKGTSTSNVVTVNKGYVGIAIYPGEASALATLNVGYRSNVFGDSFVVCGAGVTALTTITQTGGTCRTATNSTTLNILDGEHIREGTCTLTTLNLDGGACRYRSNGTLTNGYVGSGGNLDFRQDDRTKTVTNLFLYEGFEYHDPAGKVTVTNGHDFIRTAPGDKRNTWDVVPNRTWTESAL